MPYIASLGLTPIIHGGECNRQPPSHHGVIAFPEHLFVSLKAAAASRD
jgi:hypothetical protein